MIMSLITLLLGLLMFFGLNIFTRHGESITVPDLTDLTISQVKQQLQSKNLRFNIIDSTYVLGKTPGIVVTQYPLPEHKVKENRSIFLTVNAKNAPTVKMPNLKDKSYRYAQMQLKNMGLVLGEITRKPDLAKDAVLEQQYKGAEIEAGKLIEKGSTIDLIVGDGFGRTTFPLPKLLGLPFTEAKFNIEGSSLRLGSIIADKSVIDTATAVVYRQSPDYSEDKKISIGQTVDLFVMNPEAYKEMLDAKAKEEENALKEQQIDSKKEF